MISSLRLQNFRSYKDASFEFSEGVNIVIGPNASGKTNILEGLVYICTGKGFRALDKENVRNRAKWARLDGVTENNQVRVVRFKKEDHLVKKDYLINDQVKKRLPFEETLPVVMFEPDDLQLLTTSPDKRRQFIDTILIQVDKEFGRQQRDYNRTLAQRNRLLKNGQQSANQTIFAWNVRLSELGGQIAQKRVELLKTINKGLGESYSRLADKEHKVRVEYLSKLPPSNYATKMLEHLERDFQQDLLRGFTGVGPHRDDLEITINSTPIFHFASRGETRTTLLALKIQETRLVEQVRDKPPLLLLDDVFSELDGKRRAALTRFIRDYQSVITTTDADVVGKRPTKGSNTIALS